MARPVMMVRVTVAAVALTAVASLHAQMSAPEIPPEIAPEIAPQIPGLIGTVKDTGGKPLAGITITARGVGQVMSTSVMTDERGVYVFPHLEGGAYRVMTQGVGLTGDKGEVMLDGTHTASRHVVMTPLADYGMQLSGYEWFNSLPEGNDNDKRLKQILYVGCTGCHSLDVVLQNRFDEKGWNAVVKAMENSFYNGYRPGDLSAAQLRWEGQIIRHHRDELAAYLARVRGPDAKTVYRPLPRTTGDGARAVVREYEMALKETQNDPSWYTGTDWALGPSVGMHGQVGIHDVVADVNGAAWITQARETFETNRSVVKLDPATGKQVSYTVRDGKGAMAYFEQIAEPDPFDNIWMHGGGSMVRLDPRTSSFAGWREPQVMNGMNNSTDADSRGRAYGNGKSGTVVFAPDELNDKGVAYPGWHLYQQNTPGDGTTYGIAVDAHDNVWWSESYVDKIAMRDAKTGKVEEFDMHDPEYDARKALATPEDIKFYESIGGGTWAINSASPLPYMEMPRRMSADKHGDTVWVPMWAQSSLAEVNIDTHKITYHKLPFQTHPYKTTVDKDHNVWTDSGMANAAFRFTPSTGQWAMFPIPSHGCASRHISYDRYKNEVWVPCDQSNKVVRFQFRSAEQIKALEAAAQFAAQFAVRPAGK